MINKKVFATNDAASFPRGFTLTSNEIEDYLMRFISSSAYCVWRQYLRFWGNDKKDAYPSLSHLNTVTGLSEKTIRKCNKELVEKGYIKYTRGNSHYSNLYHYIPIEEVLETYKDKLEPAKVAHVSPQISPSEPAKLPPIIQHIKTTSDNTIKRLNCLDGKERVLADSFIVKFIDSYKKWSGATYGLEKRDTSSILENINQIVSDTSLTGLIDVYFNTSIEYISLSDHSIFLFFKQKTQKQLVAEYRNSDIGRWTFQAEALWEEKSLWQQIGSDLDSKKIEKLIKKNVKFSGGNQDRDLFVYNYLFKKIQETTT